MHLISLFPVIALTVCFGDFVCGYEFRQKKQLSPAVQLENDINSFLRRNGLGYKRAFQYRPNDSPEIFDMHDSLDDLLALQNIGKRAVFHPANRLSEQLDIIQHLAEVGKRNSLSPATGLQEELNIPQILMDIGRKKKKRHIR